jgi:DNA-binding winged helix-turn-helix (wHTH) protein
MPLQSPPKTIVVVGPEHPQGLRWREAMRERGALLAHTERVPQALDWLSRLAPDWLISVTPLPAPPHCRQLTWSGTQEELESLLHDIAPPPSASETLVLGELEIDPQQGRLSVQGRGSVHLPATEFRLLHCLLRHQGRAVSRQQLLDEAWPPESRPLPRSVDQVVRRLRVLLTPLGLAPRMRSLRSLGYRFDLDERTGNA